MPTNILYKIIISLVLLIGLAGAFIYEYEHRYTLGMNAGVAQEDAKLKAQYQTALTKQLQDNTDMLTKEFNVKLASVQSQQQIQTQYVDRVKTITKVVHDSKDLNNPDCTLSDDEVDAINNATK